MNTKTAFGIVRFLQALVAAAIIGVDVATGQLVWGFWIRTVFQMAYSAHGVISVIVALYCIILVFAPANKGSQIASMTLDIISSTALLITSSFKAVFVAGINSACTSPLSALVSTNLRNQKDMCGLYYSTTVLGKISLDK